MTTAVPAPTGRAGADAARPGHEAREGRRRARAGHRLQGLRTILPVASRFSSRRCASAARSRGRTVMGTLTRPVATYPTSVVRAGTAADRKSTRLNSSHANISYAVFCLKKKNNHYIILH